MKKDYKKMKNLKYYKEFIFESVKLKEVETPLFLYYWEKLPKDIKEKCENIDHNNPHHQEGSVLNHIALVFDRVVTNYSGDKDEEYLRLAAILHDLGKTAEGIRVTKGDKDTFNMHEVKSMEMIDDLLDLYEIDDPEKVKFLVENHMLVHNMDKLSPPVIRGLIENSDYFDALIKFGKCDEGGRYTSPGKAEDQATVNAEIDANIQKAIKNAEEDDRRRAKHEADLEVARVRNQQVRDAIHKSPDITIPELQNMFNDMNPKAIEGIYKAFKSV